jgi:hypothetical protein
MMNGELEARACRSYQMKQMLNNTDERRSIVVQQVFKELLSDPVQIISLLSHPYTTLLLFLFVHHHHSKPDFFSPHQTLTLICTSKQQARAGAEGFLTLELSFKRYHRTKNILATSKE